MKNDAVYWIWLSEGLGIASTAARIVLEKGLDAKALYQMDLTALIQLELFAPRLCKKIKALSLTAAYNVLEECERKGYSVITPEDDNYPRQFYALQDPPLVVYAQGDVSLLGQMHNLPVLTVVGTRGASEYGRRVAENMSYDLAKAGFIIVSGLAQGIDSYAHSGALRAGKRTAAVLGTGLNADYPAQSAPMRKQILSTGGVVLTELEPSVPVRGHYFPARNRLLAGLSQGVLVVEAPQHSGALLTAGHALEQGKEVFAVPSDIYDPNAAGTLGLIRDGAIPAINVLDVAYPYFSHFAAQIRTQDLLVGKQVPFRKRKPLQARRPAYWEEEQVQQPTVAGTVERQLSSPDKTKQPPLDRPAKPAAPPGRVRQQPDQSEQLPDPLRMREQDSRFTREMPANVLDEQWKLEKARILEEIYRNTRTDEGAEIKREQETAPRGPSTIDAAGPARPELTAQQQQVYNALTRRPQSLSEIAQRCGMSVAEVTALLFEIGVPDPVRMYPGMLFSI